MSGRRGRLHRLAEHPAQAREAQVLMRVAHADPVRGEAVADPGLGIHAKPRAVATASFSGAQRGSRMPWMSFGSPCFPLVSPPGPAPGAAGPRAARADGRGG